MKLFWDNCSITPRLWDGFEMALRQLWGKQLVDESETNDFMTALKMFWDGTGTKLFWDDSSITLRQFCKLRQLEDESETNDSMTALWWLWDGTGMALSWLWDDSETTVRQLWGNSDMTLRWLWDNSETNWSDMLLGRLWKESWTAMNGYGTTGVTLRQLYDKSNWDNSYFWLMTLMAQISIGFVITLWQLWVDIFCSVHSYDL